LFWCCIKMYNVGRIGFFVRAQPTFCIGRNCHFPIYLARKTLAHLGKKILFTDIDKKKWQSTSARKDDRSSSKKDASQDDADRTFPNRHHANFFRRLNWRLNSRHRSWNSPDWYFSADIEQFFLKSSRWQIMFFFYNRGSFLVLVLHKKNNNVRRLVFLCELNRRFLSAETGMFPFIRPGKL